MWVKRIEIERQSDDDIESTHNYEVRVFNRADTNRYSNGPPSDDPTFTEYVDEIEVGGIDIHVESSAVFDGSRFDVKVQPKADDLNEPKGLEVQPQNDSGADATIAIERP